MTISGRDAAHRPDALAARLAAYDVLAAWDEGIIDRLSDSSAEDALKPRDAALARELAFGVLRHQRLYDHLALRFLRGDNPAPLARALRLACHQLFALDRIPPHAAGDTTVEMLRRRGHPRLAGVANAVVRKLVGLRLDERRGDGPLGRLDAADQPQEPGIRHSLPDLLVAQLTPLIAGSRNLEDLNRVPPLCTRTRAGRTTLGTGIIRQEGEWTWWSDLHAALAGPVAAGDCVVQDRSQGVLIELSDPRPGERALDCCAAPGGKSLALVDRGCRVVSADLSLARLSEARAGLGRDSALVVQDARRPALAAGAFDLVVVDAPCSNSGVLGRRPEARWRYDARSLGSLVALQRELLRIAAGSVAPGGRLVYATCSLVPAEDQDVARSLSGWRVRAERLTWPDAWQAGGYVAVLVRD